MAAESYGGRGGDYQEGVVEQVGEGKRYLLLVTSCRVMTRRSRKKETADYSAITTWGVFQPRRWSG